MERTVVVVRGLNRFSKPPHAAQCLQICDGKFQQLGMRFLGTAAHVAERDLGNAPTFGVYPKQNLLQHIEISGVKLQLLHRINAIYPEATGKVLVRERKHTGKRNVKNLAEQPAEQGHVRRARSEEHTSEL